MRAPGMLIYIGNLRMDSKVFKVDKQASLHEYYL